MSQDTANTGPTRRDLLRRIGAPLFMVAALVAVMEMGILDGLNVTLRYHLDTFDNPEVVRIVVLDANQTRVANAYYRVKPGQTTIDHDTSVRAGAHTIIATAERTDHPPQTTQHTLNLERSGTYDIHWPPPTPPKPTP